MALGKGRVWGDLLNSGVDNWLNCGHENTEADKGLGRVGEREVRDDAFSYYLIEKLLPCISKAV